MAQPEGLTNPGGTLDNRQVVSPHGPARVIVVGSINEDLTLRVTRLPAPGETTRASTSTRASGGKGGNQAVAAHRAGAPVALVGALGDDAASRRLRDDLDREGVDTTALACHHGASPGTAVVTVDRHGENHIVISPGANDLLDERFVREHLRRLAPTPRDVVVTCLEIPEAGAAEALAYAAQVGATAILNPSPVRALPATVWDAGPLVICNRQEATRLTGHPDEGQAAADLARRTGRDAIVTLGGEGVLAVIGGRPRRFPSPKVHVVDTTGAGDVFCGTFAAHQAAGSTTAASITAAIQAATDAVRHPGARPAPARPA